ncbi:hypothetical protein [Klebsiella aerogenes]|uniref:hypothetical protein n=1 Tax=Klebsiella aerogenes TaxID=548 RepID=UPI002073F2B9|nr:hypothetical protein [Klebsiella aerogenes]ELA0415447.1 hypothetical protein [Klebsiella aerogenes]
MPPVMPPAPVMTCFVGWRLTPYPTYADYSNVQFGSPDKAQRAASGKIPGGDWTATDS